MSTISLICSTLGNRIYELERLLSSIKESLFQKEDMQIIVVNQNPNSQDILPLINRYKNDLNLMVINQAEKGLSKGRNYGFEFSEGDIIAFPDDDCWFPPDFFINLFNAFELYSADIILGSIHDPIKDIVYPGHKKYNGKNVKKMSKNDLFYSSSISSFFKKNVLGDLKLFEGYLFDENLGAGSYFGSGEETDIIFRLLKKGAKAYIIPTLKIYHKVEDNFFTESSKVRSYARGVGALAKKHKSYVTYKYYIEIAIKSLAASIIRGAKNKDAFNYYLSRFKGLIDGYKAWPNSQDNQI